MSFKQRQRLVFYAIAAVLAASFLVSEIHLWSSMSFTVRSRPSYSAYAVIYSNGAVGTYSIGTENGAPQPLPTANGQSYNVVYHTAGFVARFSDIYYLVPQPTLDAVTGSVCLDQRLGDNGKSCTDLRRLPGARQVARVYNPGGIILEFGLLGGGGLAALGYVWWRFIR
ncbi:MAG TPA: hypothetical protein VLF91_02540 [Candidatus Saccharimonadales bacterium]|nr:hypothetical protein [Candidatus Saccharimonadales bacterium]